MSARVFRLRIVPSVLVLGVLAACQPPATDEAAVQEAAPAVDLAAEAAAVESVSMKWLEAARARDLDAVMTVFADNAVTFPDDGAANEGPAAIRAAIQEQWTGAPDAAFQWTTKSVRVSADGDMAWERGAYTYDPDGEGKAGAETGEYITVYEKIGGEWKVVADMGSETSGDDGEDAM